MLLVLAVLPSRPASCSFSALLVVVTVLARAALLFVVPRFPPLARDATSVVNFGLSVRSTVSARSEVLWALGLIFAAKCDAL